MTWNQHAHLHGRAADLAALTTASGVGEPIRKANELRQRRPVLGIRSNSCNPHGRPHDHRGDRDDLSVGQRTEKRGVRAEKLDRKAPQAGQ